MSTSTRCFLTRPQVAHIARLAANDQSVVGIGLAEGPRQHDLRYQLHFNPGTFGAWVTVDGLGRMLPVEADR